ncbi:MAG: hemolysin III family protein [Ruminococcaceae bacterium]|nr:hemolysin III family protein [Oscillospiraceae bacterium]
MTSRTKIKDRILPIYTNGEEIFNMVTHIVGGAIGIAVLVICVFISTLKGSALGVVCSAIFGVSMIALYTMSSIYHGLRTNTSKKVFQIIDHCTIYFLIAGTYTPMLACGLAQTAPVAAWVTLAAVWILAAVATTLTAIDLKKYKVFSMICYVCMGWAIIFSIKQMYDFLGAAGFWLLLGGGIFYTGGIVFYNLGKKIKYFHSIFHIFTLFGSILHALCVMFYVL